MAAVVTKPKVFSPEPASAASEHPAPTPASPVQAKFMQARKDMDAALIERGEEIDVVLTALICQEHPLLVGPPGTGKSFLLDAVLRWMGGGRKFEILFNKFTTPEEVFGPISVVDEPLIVEGQL